MAGNRLIGFDHTKSRLIASYQENKLHHALLFCGKKGIGKASFAKVFIREILDSQMESHPDFITIETLENKREISVEQIRKINDFINQTSAISKNKFILIDAADELNKSSSNALLKILEEPHQNNFFILICHNPSKILATIKSRCQIIKINDLSLEDFKNILKENTEFKEEEINLLAKICDNSPALAINNGKALLEIYQLLLFSLKNKRIDDNLIKKTSDKNFDFSIFVQIVNFFIWRLAEQNQGLITDYNFDEKEILSRFSDRDIFDLNDKINKSLNRIIGLSLDKKLAVINIFNEII